MSERAAQRMRQLIVGGAVGALTLFGGTAAAGDYPPSDTTVTTVTAVTAVASSGAAGISNPASDPTTPALAATGSNSDTTLKLAGGALVAGAGLLVASRLRRRPAAT
jgi:LPXTG-motif cell wall-anchored protein